MAWDIPKRQKFKIGDLVEVLVKIDFPIYNSVINVGDIGLITNVELPGPEEYSLWGIDYMVLIKGEIYWFFETELKLINDKNDEDSDDDGPFVFLKY